MASTECECCGATENLVRHHITYEPEEIQILCRGCHKKEHVVWGAFKRPSDWNPRAGKRDPRHERSLIKLGLAKTSGRGTYRRGYGWVMSRAPEAEG